MVEIEKLKTITKNFISELREAQEGKDSSLSWLLHHVPHTALVKEGEIFQVLIIGGSVCRKGLVRRINGTVEILEHEKRDQPIFTSKQVFLEFVEKELLPDVRVLAINFAYPLQPIFENGKIDGMLIKGVKEHAFKGLVGEVVGQETEKYIEEKTGRNIKVSVANDTACLLLSGLTLHNAKELACGIVGTGMNAAFFIDDSSFVNLESAGFNKFNVSEEGKEVDRESNAPGRGLLEKETAGAYLYKHFNHYIKKHEIDHKPLESTYELKMLALERKGEASDIALKLIEKSASLVGCMIAAVTEFKGQDTVFVMDGSFFWEHDIYKNFVEEYVKKLTQYQVTFVQIEDTTLYGAAKLVF